MLEQHKSESMVIRFPFLGDFIPLREYHSNSKLK